MKLFSRILTKSSLKATLSTGLLLTCLSCFHPKPERVVFPLQLSPNHRYLVDQNNTPFLIREISAWGLIQALPEKEASDFMDSIRLKGFNSLLVSVITTDPRFAGDPPNWQGNSPFKVKWDFSTPNEIYFAHVDRILRLAEQKGMLLLLVPCYLGYYGDPRQGWFSKLLDSRNDTSKSYSYGQFLGKRYRDFKNLIWVAGGDNSPTDELKTHLGQIIRGIKDGEGFGGRHLWTGHWSSEIGENWSTDNASFASFMDLDGLYAFVEQDMGNSGPQYKAELEKYPAGNMYFQLDQSYEQDIPGGPDNTDYQWIRRKNYGGLLSGCVGTSFSPGISEEKQLFKFYNWQDFMNTKGMQEMKYCFDLFESRPWNQLIPDQNTSEIITMGRGNYGDTDYVCLARTASGSTVIAYLPTSRTITVDLEQVSGDSAKVWCYNPRDGHAKLIGTFSTTGKQDFASSNGDQILVIDDASLDLPAPGTEIKQIFSNQKKAK